MIILFVILSVIFSYISAEEYWNIINVFSALIILGLYFTNIKKRNILYALPVIILILKDIIWWIINIGVMFSRLAVVTEITGIIKMVSDVLIIALCLVYFLNKNFKRKNYLITQTVLMSLRIVMFILPLIIYRNTFDNALSDIIAACSYAFLFAGYLYSFTKNHYY